MNKQKANKEAVSKPELYTVLGNVISFLESIKRNHHINDEDCWYSCPSSGECCNDELDECNCGVDNYNEKIDNQINQINKMENEFKVLTGTAKEVEDSLNELERKNWVIIYGISTTNEQTTIVVGISGKK